MTTEKMNKLLYDRMIAEQNGFKSFLMKLSPKEILDHAYQYSVREDILTCVVGSELSESEICALISSRTPLADIYNRAEKNEVNIMDGLRDCITQIGDEWDARNINSKSKER